MIGIEQSAYNKGRCIGNNARTILDVYEYFMEHNSDGVLMFLDCEKAFDSIEWNFLFKTLKQFNFGDNFITWIKKLYTKPIFRIEKQWLDLQNMFNV